jgi:hypothetical protein
MAQIGGLSFDNFTAEWCIIHGFNGDYLTAEWCVMLGLKGDDLTPQWTDIPNVTFYTAIPLSVSPTAFTDSLFLWKTLQWQVVIFFQ